MANHGALAEVMQAQPAPLSFSAALRPRENVHSWRFLLENSFYPTHGGRASLKCLEKFDEVSERVK